MQYFTFSYSTPYGKSISLEKGESCYLGFYATFDSYGDKIHSKPYKFSLNKVPIFIEPLGDSSITTTNNITINNNTWNGNIYTDSSTNLTYIYPRYTTCLLYTSLHIDVYLFYFYLFYKFFSIFLKKLLHNYLFRCILHSYKIILWRISL